MKKIILPFVLLAILHMGYTQTYNAKVEKSTDNIATVTPGEIKTVKVTITNNSTSGFVYGKSDFNMVMEHTGSLFAGNVFNQTIKLPKTLPAGESYTFNGISFKTPIHPGEYPVQFTFRWGNRIIGDGGTTVFKVAEKYEATLSMRSIVLEDNRGNNISVKVTNSGGTAWPESNYSIKFELQKSPSGATAEDKARFNKTSGTGEKWDFEPGESDEYLWRGFMAPKTIGKYVVKVILLRNGKPFSAEGASKDFTFEVK